VINHGRKSANKLVNHVLIYDKKVTAKIKLDYASTLP